MRESTESRDMAQTILGQYGGTRFLAMTGARDMVVTENGLIFRLPKAKAGITHVKTEVNPCDLYDVEFWVINSSKIALVNTARDVGCENLREVFTDNTGLYCTL